MQLRNRVRVALIAVGVSLSWFHGRCSPAPAEMITGQVVDTANGGGIAGVQVELIDAIGDALFTQTDASGRYQFINLTNGTYVVHEVAPAGYVQTTPTFEGQAPVPQQTIPDWNYNNTSSWVVGAPAPFEAPVNITGPTTDLGSVLSINYNNAVPTQAINNGHQIQVQFAGSPSDSVTVAGQSFNLAQFHYHDPAENLVNGTTFPMEEHFVNVNAQGGETVLAVFLQLGAHNQALDPILDAALKFLTSPNTSTDSIKDAIRFADLLPMNMQGWFYSGSLTTPPLSLPINWFVFATPITMDAMQFEEYERLAGGSGFLPNARPTQPLGGRQFNEIDFDANLTGSDVSGLNFALTAVAVPEPSSSALMALGMAAIATVGLSRQRRRRPAPENHRPGDHQLDGLHAPRQVAEGIRTRERRLGPGSLPCHRGGRAMAMEALVDPRRWFVRKVGV